MCIKYIMYIFSMTIGPHVCDSSHITKPKKNEKIMQCPFIKSPFFFKVMVFSQKEKFIMHLLLKKWKKTHFFNAFSTKNVKLLSCLKFSSISFTTKKNSLQNSTHNLNFEIYFQFFILCDIFILKKIYFICSSL